jgi:maltooligosyltrehalose trehalohydrolase
MSWQPSFGAWPEATGIRFRIWAPQTHAVDLILKANHGGPRTVALRAEPEGWFTAFVDGLGAGARYKYRLDGKAEFPDPASRFQPEGVHGPSAIVDPTAYAWRDAGWKGWPLDDLVIYELHIGTFTPEGTFRAAAERLQLLAELGVTAVELMPVADFPGRWNWGYDGVFPFAPARCYGTPDDLRAFVDRAHQLRLSVLLDVVYNHLGPDGNYLPAFTPYWVNDRHSSPWGAALNFDGEHCGPLRQLFFDNALAWLRDFHFDGLRLDATHAIHDDSPCHFLRDLAGHVHRAAGRPVLLIAEDDRNLTKLVKAPQHGGWGLDAVWADDFHHQVRVLLAGDQEGYFADFSGTPADIATTVRQGWFYGGQLSPRRGRPHGSDPTELAPAVCVICLQNHDQVGNRAFGERLSHQVEPAAYRAAAALLLCAPETPLIFMGQEWAASAPFRYFTDHQEALGKQVTEGRRHEFRHFSAFADPHVRETIPDPQAEATFRESKLNWEERLKPGHAEVWRLYQALLRLRRSEPALRRSSRGRFHCVAVSDAVVLHRHSGEGDILAVCLLLGAGFVDLNDHLQEPLARTGPWQVLLTTEDAGLGEEPQPPEVDLTGEQPRLRFKRPGAVLLKRPSG